MRLIFVAAMPLALFALAGCMTMNQLEIGQRFRDCSECPLMVVVPEGSFLMGSPLHERGRDEDEGPVHEVRISTAFAVGVYEVTIDEYDAYADEYAGIANPYDGGWGRGSRPVINVNWEDAARYIQWLSNKTGKQYRFLSESEWEYVARGGTKMPYHSGSTITARQANFDAREIHGRGEHGSYRRRTMPVGSFPANGFGLHDVHGNVWEWVMDSWNDNYQGAPNDGTAWVKGNWDASVLRGGSWDSELADLRSANRSRVDIRFRGGTVGFRVARTLPQ